MISLRKRTFDEVYFNLRNLLFHSGETRLSHPRGHDCCELREPVVWTIEDPRACWSQLSGRRLNPFFAAAEVLWILQGRSDVVWIERFNSNIANFSDDGVTFNAAYGERLRRYPSHPPVDQIEAVVERLRKDPWTREAVVCIWDVIRDNSESKDIACNNLVYFNLREGKLNSTVIQRSNDLIWGTPYNMIQWEHVAELVLGEYNVRSKQTIGRGTHTVFVQNLHYYLKLYPDGLLSRFRTGSFWDLPKVQREYSGPRPGPISLNYLSGVWTALANWDRMSTEEILRDLEDLSGAFGYWSSLAALSTLYLRRDSLDKRQIICCVERFFPAFEWLVRDFFCEILV